MKVILESPYGGNIDRNVKYAQMCMRDSIERGEFPYASHLMLPGVLDDNNKLERKIGIEIGLEWGKCAAKTVVYRDLGITKGMQMGIESAVANGRPVEYRKLY